MLYITFNSWQKMFALKKMIAIKQHLIGSSVVLSHHLSYIVNEYILHCFVFAYRDSFFVLKAIIDKFSGWDVVMVYWQTQLLG